MRALLALLFLIGLLLIGFPLWMILNSPSTGELQQERAYPAAWPLVTGQLDEVHIQQELHTSRGALWFTVEVKYRYTIEGQEYTGTRLGIQPYRDTSPAALEIRMRRFLDPSRIVQRLDTAEGPMFRSRRISLFLANQPIPVHFDPRNPAASILDNHDYDPPRWWQPWVPALAFQLLGLVILVVVVWRWPKRAPGRSAIPRGRWSSPANSESPPEIPQGFPQDLCSDSDDWLECRRKGESLMRSGELEKALACFEQAQARAPGEAGTRHSETGILLDTGQCLMALGRPEEASRILDEAYRLATSGPGTETLAAEAHRLREEASRMGSARKTSVISPWADQVNLSSPDGKTTAVIDDAAEVGMGAPTSGRLRLSNGLTFESCNPSLVWSSDSVYLAVPQWTPLRNQRLLIISVTRRRHGYAPGEYRVLRLESFNQGVIRGIDSPVYQPRPVRVDLADIDWAEKDKFSY
jgi:hypothetical protein